MTTSTLNPRPASRGRTVALRVARFALAAVFAGAGLAKLGGEPAMVELFDDIGAGAGLRYLVGLLEVAGAVGLLVPRLTGLAALGLAALMAGATVTNVVVLGTSPLLTVALGLVAAGIAWSLLGRRGRRRPSRASVSRRSRRR